MQFLFFAMICSASVALLFSLSSKQKVNWQGILVVNYGTAITVGALFVLLHPPQRFLFKASFIAFFTEFSSVFSHTLSFTPTASQTYTILIGIIGGFFFFWSFYFYRASILKNGASLSGAFAKMGILIPLSLSLLLWKQLPSSVQMIGILFSLLAVGNLFIHASKHFSWEASLLFLVLLMGVAEFNTKIFQQYADPLFSDLYLLIVFTAAFLLATMAQRKMKQSLRSPEIIFGLGIGIVNFFSSYFLLISLRFLPAVIAFPLFSAGSILLITLGSIGMYKERLQKSEWVSLLAAFIGVVLMSI